LEKIAAREDSYWTMFSFPFRNPTRDNALGLVALALDITVDELVQYEEKLRAAKTLSDCFIPLKEIPPEVTVTAALRGEVHVAVEEKTQHQKIEVAANQTLGYCFDFAHKGNCTRHPCKFRHEKPYFTDKTRPPPLSSRVHERGLPQADIPCRQIRSGTCSFGAKCKFKHG
jgi:hypothetical protein